MNFKRKNNHINLDQLVSKLQKEDNQYAKLCKGIQIIYWIFIPFYTIMAIRHYLDSGEMSDLIGGLLYVGGFLIIAIFFGNYHKAYKYVDYSLPTLKMLKNAAYRYKPFQLKSIWVLIAILLIDTGLIIQSKIDDSFGDEQIFFFGAIFTGLAIGLIIWYFKYKPLRDNALRLIDEIEGE
ncbi:hypothetical protein L3073_00010 [Ancylomarina sp. DW003]|nr:hypothetical protein [Ancylomarina sp. DW003]MDE5420585.1 hypothetical protein [Ancylomarina sp. DW003]